MSIASKQETSAIPHFDQDDVETWDMLFSAYLRGKRNSHRALTEDCPVLDAAAHQALFDADGNPTDASREFETLFKKRRFLWRKRNDVAYSALVQACSKSSAATNLLMLNRTKTAKHIFNALKAKFDMKNVTPVAQSKLNEAYGM